MKKKQLKKKQKRVRTRDWEAKGDDSFTHDRVRHRRAQVAVSEAAKRDLNPLPKVFDPNATVISHTKKYAFVQMDGEQRLCLIDERLEEEEATLLAPGDRVLVEFEEDEAFVRAVAPRATRLVRPAHEHARVKEQVLAANVDLLVVVAAAASPPFKPGLVDRFLIAADVGDVEPILVLNKMDLVDEEPEDLALYRDLGLRVFTCSCETLEGVGEIRQALAGQVSVVAGHSGVGKSSLINALDPDLRVLTSEVSQRSDRGRHTTTGARLYELQDGIHIIDTPGIRALGLWRVDADELALYFPEIAEHAPGCRYRNCTHVHEPDCAVMAALDDETIARARYDSYLRIRASLESDTGTTPGRLIMKYTGDKGSG